jgi:ABC-type branched-subunit amino acid transport system ATPase component
MSFMEHDLAGMRPHQRAQIGIGRTFQRMQLFDSFTVLDNVRLGREAALSGRSPLRQVVSLRSDRHDIHGAAALALDRAGISHLASARVASLSTGQRRLVELARALAGGFRMLLLDEPSSGLDNAETIAFGGVLRDAVADGMGLLLVEHDMKLVMSVCDYLYVLDFGKLIFEGTPGEVQASRKVREAYLGTLRDVG